MLHRSIEEGTTEPMAVDGRVGGREGGDGEMGGGDAARTLHACML